MSEQEWAERAALFESLKPWLISRLLRETVAGSVETEDLLQVGQLGAWRALLKAEVKAEVRGPAATVAINGAKWAIREYMRCGFHELTIGRRHARTQADRPELVRFTDLTEDVPGADFVPGLVDEIDRQQVARVLLALAAPSERQCLIAYFFDGLTYSEVARRLGKSQTRVIQLVARSLERYRAWAGLRPPLGRVKVTACPHGHAYDCGNARVNRRGRRYCGECVRLRSKERYRRQKEKRQC